MLKDKVRTDTYRDSFYNNRHLISGKVSFHKTLKFFCPLRLIASFQVVLDVGSGTGILSMFAARSGAARVISVECSDIADVSRSVIKANQLDHIITLIKGKVEEIELPDSIDKVDVIVSGEQNQVQIVIETRYSDIACMISEWMGTSLFTESMLDSVIFARDKWLDKEKGIMFPDYCCLHIAAFTDDSYLHRARFCENKYDIDLTTFNNHLYAMDFVGQVSEDRVLTTSYRLKEFDLYTVKIEDTSFETRFRLTARDTGQVHAFLIYFDVEFKKCEPVLRFSTSPACPWTHWEQTVCYLNQRYCGVSVTKGEEIYGKFKMGKHEQCDRRYQTTIQAVFNDGAAIHSAEID